MSRFKPLMHAVAAALACVGVLAANAELAANEPSATTMLMQPAESETATAHPATLTTTSGTTNSSTSQPSAQTEAKMALLGAGVVMLVAGMRLREDIATHLG